MKFCYVDESGTGDEPYAVMVGVLLDASRMRPTKAEWDDLMAYLSELTGRTIKEFHTKDFYAGNSPWRGLDGALRAAVISAIFEWYKTRRHHIVYSVVDKARYSKFEREHPFAASIGTLWRTLALHLALAIQKYNQSQKRNKGNTVLIFDAHDIDQKSFSEMVISPPEWTATYYAKGKKQQPLDQIVDVPHFVDSSHVGMIQLADCISYFLRRYVEIKEGAVPPRYSGEERAVTEWVELALEQSISTSAIYPKIARCDAAECFHQLAPAAIAG